MYTETEYLCERVSTGLSFISTVVENPTAAPARWPRRWRDRLGAPPAGGRGAAYAPVHHGTTTCYITAARSFVVATLRHPVPRPARRKTNAPAGRANRRPANLKRAGRITFERGHTFARVTAHAPRTDVSGIHARHDDGRPSMPSWNRPHQTGLDRTSEAMHQAVSHDAEGVVRPSMAASSTRTGGRGACRVAV